MIHFRKVGKVLEGLSKEALLSLLDWDYKIERVNRSRTHEQNRFYWGVVIPLFSEHTGYDPEESHELLKTMFLSENKVAFGKEIAIPKSSKTLKTNEFNDYLENISRFLAEQWIVVPEPITDDK